MSRHRGAVQIRKENVNNLYYLIIQKKDSMSLKQICALYAFTTGLSLARVEDYLTVLTESGIVKAKLGKVIAVVEI